MANKDVNDYQYPLFNDVLEGMEKTDDSGGALVVTFWGTTAGNNASCDRTWAEIKTAYNNGQEIIVRYRNGSSTIDLAKMTTATRDLISLEGLFAQANNGQIIASAHCSINNASRVECYYWEYTP